MKIVVKIGGSVLVDEGAYQEQASRIRSLQEQYAPDRMYVVVSARKGESDRLITDLSCEDEEKLRCALRGECEYSAYDRSEVASYLIKGEIDSARLLSSYLPGSIVLDQENPSFPIVANSSHLCGVLDERCSVERRGMLEPDADVVVISGFGGVDHYGNTVLLGRNSSDLVAAAVSHVADADQLVYLKDVDGVLDTFGSVIPYIPKSSLRSGKYGEVLDPRICDIVERSRAEVRVGNHAALCDIVRDDAPYSRIV